IGGGAEGDGSPAERAIEGELDAGIGEALGIFEAHMRATEDGLVVHGRAEVGGVGGRNLHQRGIDAARGLDPGLDGGIDAAGIGAEAVGGAGDRAGAREHAVGAGGGIDGGGVVGLGEHAGAGARADDAVNQRLGRAGELDVGEADASGGEAGGGAAAVGGAAERGGGGALRGQVDEVGAADGQAALGGGAGGVQIVGGGGIHLDDA